MFYPPEYTEEAIRDAATRLLTRLGARLDALRSSARLGDEAALAEVAAIGVQMALAVGALESPGSSIGTCAYDGSELRFVGREDGLYVCCTGEVQHCWKIGI